jgi:hypothetical protein
LHNILIITPHYPPSNLAAVHRSRLFAQHLPEFGWQPLILTVHQDHYEEALDPNLEKLLPAGQRVEKVKAMKVTKPRLIGDIGLRGFFQLRQRALELVSKEGIDFVYIPIPSFYASLIGPYLHRRTGVRYGIDYIDPWVHVFPGSDRMFSRHWWSMQLAKWLEPKAVRDASLITGVAEGYYQGVLERNPGLKANCLFGAMPYGGEPGDQLAVEHMDLEPYLFRPGGKLKLVYAGALLPKAYGPLEVLFRVLSEKQELFREVEFHFIGTGKGIGGGDIYAVKDLALRYGIWEKTVFEHPRRIPYLDVLIHLKAASGVFILGSTEPHYTPSKVFQAVLSRKPIFAVLHNSSTALQVINDTGAGIAVPLDPERLDQLGQGIIEGFTRYQPFLQSFHADKVSQEAFAPYSAREITRRLAALLDQAVER